VHWDFALILLVLALVVPLLGKRRIRRLMDMPHTTKRDRLRLYISTVLSQWFAASVMLWRATARGISLGQLGIAIPRAGLTVSVSVVLAALVLVNQLASLRQMVAQPSEMTGILPQLALRIFPQDNVERAVFFLVVVTVAICEEVIYRGFVQTVLGQLGGSVLLGAAGAAFLFGIAHIYQGRRGVTTTLVVGVIFSLVRAWTGSLMPAVISHFIADFAIGFIAPNRLRLALK
jgi:membrane protease YdiL (CAAX protease family)